jgi:hypothetical protein
MDVLTALAALGLFQALLFASSIYLSYAPMRANRRHY